jgi:hypothetical protein
LSTPLGRGPARESSPGDPAEALDKRTRLILGIIAAVAGIVAMTHQSLTAALASAHRDSATAQESRLLLGFAIVAILGAGPMVLFCLATVVIFLLVITFGLIFLVVLLLLMVAWVIRRLGSCRGENIRVEAALAPACLFHVGRRGLPDPG